MLIASGMARDLASEYSKECTRLAQAEADPVRKDELLQMAAILRRVPWEPAHTFWEALQSLWLTHMLVMADENYPGPGVSFGRLDQYLSPLWKNR
jgi:formate C-acetyltransferase